MQPLPRENLFRGLFGVPIHYRAPGTFQNDGPVLEGHFAVFSTWSEISSFYEGNFMEQMAPGAFKKTIRENGPKGTNQIRCLFQHGMDFQVDNKPLGPFEELSEDETGVYYRVPLLDTSYNRDLAPGLEAGVYGASFRFRVLREDFNEDPGASDHNPKGLPERTIKEVQLMEGGPVTFGAYKEATAGIAQRSLTDDFILDKFAKDPERFEALVQIRETRIASDAPAPDPEPEAEVVADAPEDEASRDDAPPAEPVTTTTPRRPVKDYLTDGPPSWQL